MRCCVNHRVGCGGGGCICGGMHVCGVGCICEGMHVCGGGCICGGMHVCVRLSLFTRESHKGI